jgi:hypothetical protein
MSPITELIGGAKAYGFSLLSGAVGSYEDIATITVGGGGSSSIVFSSIPQTFTHLQLRGVSRTSRSSSEDEYRIRFNSNSSGLYTRHALAAYGSGSEMTGFVNQDHWRAGWTAAANITSGMFGPLVFDILDYTNTNKNTSGRGFVGYEGNTTGGVVGFVSGLWRATDAVSSIEIAPAFSPFIQHTTFSLYGIKAAA